MKNENNILRLLRAGEVARYHTTPEIPPQNVAAHSWNVAVLAHFIADKPAPEIVFEALWHDSTEFFSGDIPPPFKDFLEERGFIFEIAEEHFAPQIYAPDGLIVGKMSPIVQVADKLDLLRQVLKQPNAKMFIESAKNALLGVLHENKDVLSNAEISRAVSLGDAFCGKAAI